MPWIKKTLKCFYMYICTCTFVYVFVCSRHQRLVTVVFRRCVQINLLTYLFTCMLKITSKWPINGWAIHTAGRADAANRVHKNTETGLAFIPLWGITVQSWSRLKKHRKYAIVDLHSRCRESWVLSLPIVTFLPSHCKCCRAFGCRKREMTDYGRPM